MPNTIGERFQNAWNAFFSRDPTKYFNQIDYGLSSSYRPDRHRLMYGADRSIVSMVYNRIAVDVASIDVEHVRIDQDGRYKETIQSELNNCLTLDANVDQTGRALFIDICMSMFDEGCVAIVPTDTSYNPLKSESYKIHELRTGKVIEWFPRHVRVAVYNENIGRKEELILPKSMVAIVENPLYAIMNEPNSTLQRLIRTLAKLDLTNEQNSSGKLDLIIQLPYVIKSKARQDQAELRRTQIEAQLSSSKYGIAYTDGTERITQLNRAVENNLWTQVKDLTSMLYNQLGLTEEVFNGTADEKTMLNYYNRTINPILEAITEEMMRKYLTKTARTQGQAIRYFRDPFRLVPINDFADVADRLTRNEIATSNEIRAELGWKPIDSPVADQLRNSNINPIDETGMGVEGGEQEEYTDEQANSQLDELDNLLDDLENSL